MKRFNLGKTEDPQNSDYGLQMSHLPAIEDNLKNNYASAQSFDRILEVEDCAGADDKGS